MKLKHLISICFLLILGACSSENRTATNEVELEMRFVSNTPLVQYQLTSEEFLQLLNSNSEHYKSIDFSTLEIDGVTTSSENETITFDFPNSGSKAKYKTSDGYDITAYEYPITVTVEATPMVENAQTEYKLVNLAAIDYYNGSLLQETAFVDDTKLAGPIYLEKMFEAKQTAWDKDSVINGIIEVPSAEDPGNTHEIALNGFTYLNEHFKYDSEKAELVRNSPSDISNAQGLEKFLQSKEGVCFDFAYFYKLYLDTHNIENRLAFGNFNGDPKKVNHVWNEIKINDEWIQVDTTGNGFGSEGKYENYVSVYTTNL